MIPYLLREGPDDLLNALIASFPLTVKRAVACCNSSLREQVQLHSASELWVRKSDATFENAKFVASLPRLHTLYVEGEKSLPEGKLEIARLRGVDRIICASLTFETALFLGAALASGQHRLRLSHGACVNLAPLRTRKRLCLPSVLEAAGLAALLGALSLNRCLRELDLTGLTHYEDEEVRAIAAIATSPAAQNATCCNCSMPHSPFETLLLQLLLLHTLLHALLTPLVENPALSPLQRFRVLSAAFRSALPTYASYVTADHLSLRGLLTAPPPPAFLPESAPLDVLDVLLAGGAHSGEHRAVNDVNPEASGPRCTLRLVSHRGESHPEVVCYRVPYHLGLGALMEAHSSSAFNGPDADQIDLDPALRYYHHGRRLRVTDTPESLRMGDEEIIEVGAVEELDIEELDAAAVSAAFAGPSWAGQPVMG